MLAAALAAVLVAIAPPSPADRAAAVRGGDWIAARAPADAGGIEADAVVALAALGRPGGTRLRALVRLAPSYAQAPGPAAKTLLAAVAAGRDPRCFGGVDLVARIRSGYADGVFGASIWDQSLSIAALTAAAEAVPPAALTRLRAMRRDGGWGFAIVREDRDDVDSTAIALMALRAAGVPVSDEAVRGGVAWLLGQRAGKAGWRGAAGTGSNANSTGLAVRALVAAGRTAPSGALRALRSLQQPDGSFALAQGLRGSADLATAESVPALVRRPWPIGGRSAPGRPCGI
jgi:hypothetical protein